jgi:uncharacterized protein (DUF433 family)
MSNEEIIWNEACRQIAEKLLIAEVATLYAKDFPQCDFDRIAELIEVEKKRRNKEYRKRDKSLLEFKL